MLTESISKRIDRCWTRVLCAIVAYAILSMSPIGVAAQVFDPPVFTPGLHHLRLLRIDESAIGYAISIPSAIGINLTPVMIGSSPLIP